MGKQASAAAGSTAYKASAEQGRLVIHAPHPNTADAAAAAAKRLQAPADI